MRYLLRRPPARSTIKATLALCAAMTIVSFQARAVDATADSAAKGGASNAKVQTAQGAVQGLWSITSRNFSASRLPSPPLAIYVGVRQLRTRLGKA